MAQKQIEKPAPDPVQGSALRTQIEKMAKGVTRMLKTAAITLDELKALEDFLDRTLAETRELIKKR